MTATTFLVPDRSTTEARAAVIRALSDRQYRHASAVARTTRLPVRRVRAILHELAAELVVMAHFEGEPDPFARLTRPVAWVLDDPPRTPTFKHPRDKRRAAA